MIMLRLILKAKWVDSTIMDTDNEIQYDYKSIPDTKIDMTRLDKVMDLVLESGTSKINTILAMVKVLIYLAYLTARRIIIDEQMKRDKQKYEISQHQANSNDLSGDNLD